jgi:hypothetical protein
MTRSILSLLAALVCWVLVASALNRLLRFGMPGYLAAEPTMAFSLAMQCARLALGALASLAGGFLLARLAPEGARLPLLLGIVLLVAFIPVHARLWNSFPLWYHLFFLVTLVPFVLAGARFARTTRQKRL